MIYLVSVGKNTVWQLLGGRSSDTQNVSRAGIWNHKPSGEWLQLLIMSESLYKDWHLTAVDV